MIHFDKCQRCGEMVPKGSLRWTKDADGEWLRRVCRRCLEDIRIKGYDEIEKGEEKKV